MKKIHFFSYSCLKKILNKGSNDIASDFQKI